MLDYVISLMTTNDSDSLDLNLLRTQEKLWIFMIFMKVVANLLVEYVFLPFV
jgi:hypothetical protein